MKKIQSLMASNPIIFTTLLLILSHISKASSSADSPSGSPTVFDILPEFGLPSGLLPDSVVNYTLSKNDGSFVVVLEGPCYVEFDYLVYYDQTITGKLGYGSITELKGIQVRRFLIWFDVDEIRVDLPPSDNIYFQLGFINKRLDIDQFKIVRTCYYGHSGCSGLRSLKFNPTLQLPNPTKEVEMLLTE